MITYYTVYKVTNKVNGKFYIGTHKTNNLDDGYMGSGKYLKRSIKKYGIENFEKEILFIFDNPDDMFQKEAEIVNEDFLAEENTYNLRVGGVGGFDYVNQNLPLEVRIKNGKKGSLVSKERMIVKYGVEHNTKIPEIKNKFVSRLKRLHKEGVFKAPSFKGRKHSEETKKKIGETNSKKQSGSKNSQYGTMWITNEVESKKIRKDEPIPEGWNIGRKIQKR